MPYYITYLEVNGVHAALMVSQQEQYGGPTKVVTEVGFGPNLMGRVRGLDVNSGQMSGFLSKTQGKVAEEPLASQAVYRNAKVEHRTYEISEAELAKFYDKVNRDRKLQVDRPDFPTVAGKDNPGGADYQYLLYNCKKWALETIREIGVVDAERLSNFIIQRPASTPSELSSLKPLLQCPEKDEFVKEFSDILEQTKAAVTSLEGSYDNQELLQGFKDAVGVLDEFNKKKIGIDQSFPGKYKDASERLGQIIDSMSEEHPQYSALNELKTKIERQQESNVLTGNLEFVWRDTPKPSPRVDTSNFTKEEEAIYDVRIRTNETTDALAEVASILGARAAKTEAAEQDTDALLQMVVASQERIREFTGEYDAKVQSPDELTVFQASLEQHHNLDKASHELITNIESYQAQAPDTGIFKKIAVGFLNFVNAPTLAAKIAPQVVIQNKLDELKAKVKSRMQAENEANFDLSHEALRITRYLHEAEREAQKVDQEINKYLDPEIMAELKGENMEDKNFLETKTKETYNVMLDTIEKRFGLEVGDSEHVHDRAEKVQRALFDATRKHGFSAHELRHELDGLMYQTNRSLKDLQGTFLSEVEQQKGRNFKKSIAAFFKPLSRLWERVKTGVTKIYHSFKHSSQLKSGVDAQDMAQSTHLQPVHRSVNSSLKKLTDRYSGEIDEKKAFREIERHIKSTDTLDGEKKDYALRTLQKARESTTVDVYSGRTFGDALSTVWEGAKDTEAYEDKSEEARKSRMDGVVRNMYLANREYNLDEFGVDDGKESRPACLAGHVNKMAEALDRIHPDVTIIQSASILSDLTLEAFDKEVSKLPPEDQIALYKDSIGEADDPESVEAIRQRVYSAVRDNLNAFNDEILDGSVPESQIGEYIEQLEYKEVTSPGIEKYKAQQEAAAVDVTDDATPGAGATIETVNVGGLEINSEKREQFQQQFATMAPMLRGLGHSDEMIAKRVSKTVFSEHEIIYEDAELLSKVANEFLNPSAATPSVDPVPGQSGPSNVEVEGVTINAEMRQTFKEAFELFARQLRPLGQSDEQIAKRTVKSVFSDNEGLIDRFFEEPEVLTKVANEFMSPSAIAPSVDPVPEQSEPSNIDVEGVAIQKPDATTLDHEVVSVAGLEVTAEMKAEYTRCFGELFDEYSKIQPLAAIKELALSTMETLPGTFPIDNEALRDELIGALSDGGGKLAKLEEAILHQEKRASAEATLRSKITPTPRASASARARQRRDAPPPRQH